MSSEPESVAPPKEYVRYPAIKKAPKEIQDDIRKMADEGNGGTLILRFLIEKYNYKPALAAVCMYIRKYRKAKAQAIPVANEKASGILADVQSEISHVHQLLNQLPSTSEKANVLKGLIKKCIDRISEIEKLPLTPQNEGSLVRYLGEIRENVSLFNKLAAQEKEQEKLIESIVQQEFVALLGVMKEVVGEVCPEYLPAIAERLKLRLQNYSTGIHGPQQ